MFLNYFIVDSINNKGYDIIGVNDMSKFENVYDLIIKLADEIKQFDYENGQDFTLNVADVYILKMIRVRTQTITSLTQSLTYDKAFISRRVRFLEKIGLLKKVPLNRKSNMIELTIFGGNELKKIQTQIDQVYHDILTEEEVDILLEIGKKVSQRIENKKK